METGGWLRLIIVGLILAAMAAGYFLLSNKFLSSKSNTKNQTQQTTGTNSAVLGQASASPYQAPSQSPTSAYKTIADRNQAQVQTLPKTGAPIFLIGIFASSAIVAGFSLRRFPN